jgi:hypothetical protein
MLLTAIGGAWMMTKAYMKGLPFDGPILYVLILVVIPAIAAIGIWCNKKWALTLSVLFFTPQILNFYSKTYSFKFMSSISFWVTLGNKNSPFILVINLFALFMFIFMLHLQTVHVQNTPNKALKAQPSAAGDAASGAP